MQPIADLQLLQIAEMAVELAERRIGGFIGADPAILVEPAGGGEFQDLVAQQLAAPGIEPGRLVIFVDQPLQIAQAGRSFRRGSAAASDDR